ncbi:MAG: CDP-alcohol phosphatidyltransferase family protein [Alphaproteobacteria bacterium]
MTASSMVVARAVDLGPGYVSLSTAIYGAFAALVLGMARAYALPTGGFGAANRMTLARVVVACLTGGLVLHVRGGGVEIVWVAVGGASFAALLDGFDGWIARRTGTASPFGARFDMEADALLIMLLAVLVWRLDKTGAWVLAAGFIRYGFVAATLLWPWLDDPLPPSRRRRAICALQMVALSVCLAPPVSSGLATAIAATAVTALGWSFVLDIAWLTRNERTNRRS